MVSSDGTIRPHYQRFVEGFAGIGSEDVEAKRRAVDLAFLRQGVTLNVYGDAQGTERVFPFDLVPRIIPAHESVQQSDRRRPPCESRHWPRLRR